MEDSVTSSVSEIAGAIEKSSSPANHALLAVDRGVYCRFIRYSVLVILLIAIGFTFAQRVATLSRPLNYAHGWVSADLGLQARSFNNSGVVALRGAPFSNNPPYGVHPEPYLHWPPLYPMLLSFAFHLFGESEATIHRATLLMSIVTGALIYFSIRTSMGGVAGAFGVLAWLSRVAVMRYSRLNTQLNLAILFVVLSVLVFEIAARAVSGRRSLWTTAGAVTVFCGVISSWEAAFVPVGLLAGSLWVRDRVQRRIALIWLASGVVAAAAVLGWYALAYPDLAQDTLVTVSYRMGLSDLHSANPLYHLDERATYPYLSLGRRFLSIATFLIGTLGWLGILAIGACVWQFLKRDGTASYSRTIPILGGLLAPPLMWFAAFSNHAAIHEYEYLLAAPAAAWAIAWCADTFLRSLAMRRDLPATISAAAVALIGALVLILPILGGAASDLRLRHTSGSLLPLLEPRANVMAPDAYVRFGLAIRDATQEGAVVLTPELNQVPMFYSQRHLITGVITDADLKRVLPLAKANFPGSPLYLARDRDGRPEIVKLTP
jgi:4-amino-4-deoxy-L-arabinose transferase-like glycosyltransferase